MAAGFAMPATAGTLLSPPGAHADPPRSAPVPPAPAAIVEGTGATLTVGHCLDDGSSDSLRGVLASASDGDTIDLSALGCDLIALNAQTLTITQANLLIRGNPDLRIAIDGGATVRVIDHQGTGLLQLQYIDLINGRHSVYPYTGGGGCLQTAGSLVLDHVSIRNCRAVRTQGGGIHVEGGLTMLDSEVADSYLEGTGFFHYGGGISVFGDAVIRRSRIVGNTLNAHFGFDIWTVYGAGIYARQRIVLEDSEVSGNTGYGMMGQGGGVFALQGGEVLRSRIVGNTITNEAGGSHEPGSTAGGGLTFGDLGYPIGTTGSRIEDSFIADNFVHGTGGGLALRQGSTLVEYAIYNTTISGNLALAGGGAHLAGTARVFNSTITANQAQAIDGIGGEDGGIQFWHTTSGTYESELQSVLVANNLAGPSGSMTPSDLGALADTNATQVDAIGANNLIAALDQNVTVPADTLSADPLLLPLADNGGNTQTHALAEGSPAIDAGNNVAALAYDQRGEGFERSYGQTDIGAYEVQSPLIFADGFE